MIRIHILFTLLRMPMKKKESFAFATPGGIPSRVAPVGVGGPPNNLYGTLSTNLNET